MHLLHPRLTASLWLRGCRPHVTPTQPWQFTRRCGVRLVAHSPLQARWQHSSVVTSSTTTTGQLPCVVVIGGGAIGLLFTALLSLTPQPPQLFVLSRSLSARPASAPSVQVELLPATLALLATDNNIAVTSPLTIPRSSIFASASALLSSASAPPTIDAMLITTKGLPALSKAVADAEQLSRHHFNQPPLIVPIMNGIAHLTRLPNHFPTSRLLYATTSQGAHWPSADLLRQAGTGMTTFVLPAGGGESGSGDDRVAWFRALVCSAAMDVRVVTADQLLSVHWSKLMVNCVINPLTALINVRNGWLLPWLEHDATARRIVRHIVREVVEVGRRHGVTFAFEDNKVNASGAYEVSEAEVDAAVLSVLVPMRATAGNVSSMASDVRAGRVTEVDGMNGEVVRLGKRYGVETPYNRALWELVTELHPAGE